MLTPYTTVIITFKWDTTRYAHFTCNHHQQNARSTLDFGNVQVICNGIEYGDSDCVRVWVFVLEVGGWRKTLGAVSNGARRKTCYMAAMSCLVTPTNRTTRLHGCGPTITAHGTCRISALIFQCILHWMHVRVPLWCIAYMHSLIQTWIQRRKTESKGWLEFILFLGIYVLRLYAPGA